MPNKPIAIIGGGLSGLYAAYSLQRLGIAFDLFEARSRLGGRILSTAPHGLDLGPTWFWPDFQPRMQRLVHELGLPTFEQHEAGDALVERGGSALMRHSGYHSRNRSMRITGGTGRVIQALAAELPTEHIHLNTPIHAAYLMKEGVQLTPNHPIYCSLWLALPPRLIASMGFTPALAEGANRRLEEVATWMAAHAKYVAHYKRPFWRDQALSGTAFSAVGPLGEIHDASQGDNAALFGFFAIDAQQRQTIDAAELKAQCRSQLTRLFGPDAVDPLDDALLDWAADAFTATAADQVPPREHATHDLSDLITAPWLERLHLVGSEAAPKQGGYMEGALHAVDTALQSLNVE